MECVRVILMTSFFSDEINLKMTANNDNRLRGSLPEIITKRIVGECSSSVTDSTLEWSSKDLSFELLLASSHEKMFIKMMSLFKCHLKVL